MKQILLSAILILGASSGVFAQNVDIITASDGSVYEGYILEQKPQSHLIVMSYKTTLSYPKDDVRYGRMRECPVAELTDEQAELFPFKNAEDKVTFYDLSVLGMNGKEKEYRNSLVYEDGVEIKFVSYSATVENIAWKSVLSCGKVPYDDDVESGVMDVLMLENAERVEGQLLETNLRTHFLKFRMKDGTVRNYAKSKVQSVRTETVDPKADLWQKMPYCDELTLKDKSKISGIIIAKQFGKQVTILMANSSISKEVPTGEIESYGKYPNLLYVKSVKEEIAEVTPDLFINGIERSLHPIITFEKSKEMSVNVPLDSVTTVVKAGEKVIIKMKGSTRTSQLRLVQCTKRKETTTIQAEGFSSKVTMVQYKPYFTAGNYFGTFNSNVQLNDGKYVVVDAIISNPGVYAFYVDGQNKCALFKVDEK